MRTSRMRFALAALLLAGLSSCRSPSVGDVLVELQGSEFVRSLEVPGYSMAFRYVPETQFRLLQGRITRGRSFDARLLDSLAELQGPRRGANFFLTVSPSRDTLSPLDFGNDVIYGQARRGQSEAVVRKYMFGLGSSVWLESEGRRHDITSYTMSDGGGITKSRTFLLVFGTLEKLPQNRTLSLVSEGLVPGQGREKIQWKLPVSKYAR